MKKFFVLVLNTLFPRKCVFCNQTGKWLCQKHKALKKAPESQVEFVYLDEILALYSYKDKLVRKLIYKFKFKFCRDVGGFFIKKIKSEDSENRLALYFENYVLVPIPIHWTRRVERGFNQSQILSDNLVKQYSGLACLDFLTKKRRSKKQSKLNKEQRKLNVRDLFSHDKNKLIPKKVCLVDDIVASGETLEEAARYLKSIGVENVKAFVLARGEK